ncbi:MAG TPA: low molecular weight protein-tyrosine-phosphatase [Sphingomonadaceae bacterium]|nr:low molecular weight protein-tyrosine-phosphatase [Sphingomonadaceae bacterium]
MTPSVLFVCLGNICRSPLAEAAFRREAAGRALRVEIDSAGTGTWNLGKAPDERAQAVARREGFDISHRRARQVTVGDFARFTHIVALDARNLADLEAMRPEGQGAELSLLLDHVPGRAGEAVADPYHGDAASFDETWRDVQAGAHGLADRLTGT